MHPPPKKFRIYFCFLEPPRVNLIYPQVFQGIQVLYAQNPPKKKHLSFSYALLEPPKVHLLYPQFFQGIQVLYAQNPPNNSEFTSVF